LRISELGIRKPSKNGIIRQVGWAHHGILRTPEANRA
jgi:hypothetical protein